MLAYCERCGQSFLTNKGAPPADKEKHQGRATCIVRSKLRSQERQGLAPIALTWRKLLDRTGFPYEMGVSRTTRFWKGHGGWGKLVPAEQMYIPVWMAYVVSNTRILLPVREKLLRAAVAHGVEAIDALYRLRENKEEYVVWLAEVLNLPFAWDAQIVEGQFHTRGNLKK